MSESSAPPPDYKHIAEQLSEAAMLAHTLDENSTEQDMEVVRRAVKRACRDLDLALFDDVMESVIAHRNLHQHNETQKQLQMAEIERQLRQAQANHPSPVPSWVTDNTGPALTSITAAPIAHPPEYWRDQILSDASAPAEAKKSVFDMFKKGA